MASQHKSAIPECRSPTNWARNGWAAKSFLYWNSFLIMPDVRSDNLKLLEQLKAPPLKIEDSRPDFNLIGVVEANETTRLGNMAQTLSNRAAQLVPDLDIPWRWAPRGSYSPDNNPFGLVSFATAENVHFPADVFTYNYSTAGGPKLPTLFAEYLNEYFRPSRPLDGSEIRFTGAATAMHEILAWAVGDPNDGILTSKPVYGRFELDFSNKAQLRMIYAETTPDTSFEVGVVDSLEEALVASRCAGVKIRALLIVNPNNPLGRCYPRKTLVQLMKFCQKHQIHLISDEVYALSVFGEGDGLPGFTSVLTIEPGYIDDELLHVIYGFSKDFSAAGLRLGCLITRSTAMLKLIQMVMRFVNPSGASVAVAIAMLANREWCRHFFDTSRRRIGDAYAHATLGLSELGIRFLPANAGFFVYIDLSPHLKKDVPNPEFELSQRLLDAGVFLHPKEEHGDLGWFRMVYTQDPRIVTEGFRR
ncbi:1-aminocyclopropane-1-carboxylate synthase 1-like protein [Cladobotryum mycophilum]|uniref:1-aminocyclopropane-1-carboxylate synthase 1-like protein n=1 Tax=Cladobotryum mycophilum TaxID=491253 RepID=A0ABR0SSN9_9HYPO